MWAETIAATRKTDTKLRKTGKTWKKNNTDESDFSENEIPDLNSLKPFEFESKTNIRNINTSQKQSLEVFYNKRCS